MVPDELVIAHRKRGFNPEHPFIRGTAQNPDVYFQGRETVNFYNNTPGIVEEVMHVIRKTDRPGIQTIRIRRHSRCGTTNRDHGIGKETVEETVKALNAAGRKTGAIVVRLYRPFSLAHL